MRVLRSSDVLGAVYRPSPLVPRRRPPRLDRTPDELMDAARVARAAEAISDGRAQVEPTGGGQYEVSSFTTPGVVYTVQLEPERDCTCPDSLYRGVRTCKHTAAVLLEGPHLT